TEQGCSTADPLLFADRWIAGAADRGGGHHQHDAGAAAPAAHRDRHAQDHRLPPARPLCDVWSGGRIAWTAGRGGGLSRRHWCQLPAEIVGGERLLLAAAI